MLNVGEVKRAEEEQATSKIELMPEEKKEASSSSNKLPGLSTYYKFVSQIGQGKYLSS